MSIQDQLLKAGLIDKNKHRQEKTAKRKKVKQPTADDDAAVAKRNAQKSIAEKAQRDRELNKKHAHVAEQKAIIAQIIQLIDSNRIDRDAQDTAYSFTDGKLIKKLQVSAQISEAIGKGQLAIVRRDAQDQVNTSESLSSYDLVPRGVAEKIQERNASFIVVMHDRQSANGANADTVADEDPYAQYEIPDDLMW